MFAESVCRCNGAPTILDNALRDIQLAAIIPAKVSLRPFNINSHDAAALETCIAVDLDSNVDWQVEERGRLRLWDLFLLFLS